VTKDEFIKALIGRPGRLRLAAWILANDDAFFYQWQAVTGTGNVISEVQICLGQLEKLGLIEASPRSSREKYYRRLSSPTWEVFRSTITAVASLERSSFFDAERRAPKKDSVRAIPRRIGASSGEARRHQAKTRRSDSKTG
jgi:hypothetical protein